MQYGTAASPSDVEGKARFSGSQWVRKRILRLTARRPIDARDLLDHALSYPTSLEGILRNKDEFERNLEKLLAPHYKTSNQTVVEILNWGIEYSRA